MANAWGYPLDHQTILRRYKSRIRELRQTRQGGQSLRIALLGGSTTAQIADLTTAFLLGRGWDAQWFESEYNQYYQLSLCESSALAAFDPDLIYLHVNCRNLQQRPALSDDEAAAGAKVAAECQHWQTVWQGLHSRYPRAVVVQNLFEPPLVRLLGNLDGLDPRGGVSYCRRINRELIVAAAADSRLVLHDLEYLAARLGLDRWYDEHLWFAYKYAVSQEALVELAHSLSGLIAAAFGGMRKAIVTDLDNTLWGGVIGDDGLEHIRLGPETGEGEAHATLQRYLAGLRERGVLLAVASKNEENLAQSGFSHPNSVLRVSDFAAFSANWRPKTENIRQIASQLNIALDSLVFLDDNPMEREQVSTMLPMVATPDVGADVAMYVQHLERNGWFETLALSQDDLSRSRYYADNADRQQLAQSAGSYREYLVSLNMQADLVSFSPPYLDRITQLINKTNQFNLTTWRLSSAEVETLAKSSEWLTLTARLADKFGDNGLVSVLAAKQQAELADIRLWLMSCRVLHRDLELAMLDELVRLCLLRGVKTLHGRYLPSGRNSLVACLYADLGFDCIEKAADGSTLWQLQLANYADKNDVIEVKR